MISAIVYKTNTGNTEGYAKLLGNQADIPVYELSEAMGVLDKNIEIVFLGWVMADGIQGYKEAKEYFDVLMVCAVGLASNAERESIMRDKNEIPENMKLFILQGGFYPDKLKGVSKMIMNMISKSTINKLTKKEILTDEEKDFLDLLQNGGSRVSIENLAEPIKWIENNSIA